MGQPPAPSNIQQVFRSIRADSSRQWSHPDAAGRHGHPPPAAAAAAALGGGGGGGSSSGGGGTSGGVFGESGGTGAGGAGAAADELSYVMELLRRERLCYGSGYVTRERLCYAAEVRRTIVKACVHTMAQLVSGISSGDLCARGSYRLCASEVGLCCKDVSGIRDGTLAAPPNYQARPLAFGKVLGSLRLDVGVKGKNVSWQEMEQLEEAARSGQVVRTMSSVR